MGETDEGRVGAPSAALIRLAEACGISAGYTGWDGVEHRCSARAVLGALAAMGISPQDDTACQRELDRMAAEEALRIVPPVTVTRENRPIEIPVHVPKGLSPGATLLLESGDTLDPETASSPPSPPESGRRVLDTTLLRFENLPIGYHSLVVVVPGVAPSTCSVIVTPERLDLPQLRRRPVGLMVHLPSVRSAASWGMGDLADLRDLAILGARKAGMDFVAATPLSAAEPVPPLTPSPYLPTTRQFIHPLLIRIEDIPEAAYLDAADRALVTWLGESPREASRTRRLLDRDAAWAAKKSALEDVFKAPLTTAREALFQTFRDDQGKALTDFATWCAIVEERASTGETGPWPPALARPSSPGVERFRDDHADRVRFYEWLQWVADEQRANAQAKALEAGMSVGIVTDLAVGVNPLGAEAWMLGNVLARGVGVGAPPDMYNQLGQNWSQPPWQPRALKEAAYAPFRDTVRATLRHAGAIRLDHILGLFRLWWVPDGCRPDEGVYVHYDHEALIGILVLEAQRAGAIVIGEDLGTVEAGVGEYLASRGILGTTIMWFEKDGTTPRSPHSYRPHTLASVTVHDLPPTAAYLAGEQVNLRESLGLLTGPVDEVRAEAEQERVSMVRMLVDGGWLSAETVDDPLEVLVALHRALASSPCALIGVSVPDLVGDVRTLNQPGTDTEYPNWKIPLCDGRGAPVPLDTLFDHPHARAVLRAFAEAPNPISPDGAGAGNTT